MSKLRPANSGLNSNFRGRIEDYFIGAASGPVMDSSTGDDSTLAGTALHAGNLGGRVWPAGSSHRTLDAALYPLRPLADLCGHVFCKLDFLLHGDSGSCFREAHIPGVAATGISSPVQEEFQPAHVR